MTQQATEVRHGILKSFDSGTYHATVQFTGSLMLFVPAIPVSRDIGAGDMTAGRKVAVAFFDPMNQSDAVLFAIWT